MTDTDISRFCKAAQATLHVDPEGYITITTVRGDKPVVTSACGWQIARAINEHARRVFA